MVEGWLTFTDFRAARATAIRVPTGSPWEAVTLADDADGVKVWRTADGQAAVIQIELDPTSGLPPLDFEVDGLGILDLLHSPTLDARFAEAVVCSRLEATA